MRPRPSRTRAAGAGALVGAVVLAAALLMPGAADAATSYPAAATITTAGPTIFPGPSTDQPVADLRIEETIAGGIPTGYVCLTPSNGSFVASGPGAAPVVLHAANGIAVANPTVTTGGMVSFQVTAASTSAPGTITIADLHATTGGTPGRSVVTVTDGLATACAPTGGHTLNSDVSAWAIETSTQDTYGTSAADTTAVEYGEEFSCSGTTGTVAHTAVLATSADPYDALAAASLEGALHAGLLVTSPASLDASTASALRNDGVTTVYVVGGSLAVSPSVEQKLGSTPSTECQNGVPATTGRDVRVVGPIAGANADATAAAIVAQANAVSPFSASQPPIDLSGVTTTTYNDTSGNASSSGTSAAAGTTAVLLSDRDLEDAMAASGMVYATHLPILLTPGGHLGSAARTELQKLGSTQVVVLGGELAVQGPVVDSLEAMGMHVVRIAGADATDTAGMIARFEDAQGPGTGLGWAPSPAGTALLAQGATASDALGAAAISGSEKASIFLTESPTKGLGIFTPRVLGDAGAATGLGDRTDPTPIYHLDVLGGPLAVTRAQIGDALAALAGAAG